MKDRMPGRAMHRAFFELSPDFVAPRLLGKILAHRTPSGVLAGRIVEVEAYLGLADRASHAFRGITNRSRIMFGPPGYAYVYFIYGMYDCLNFVTEPDGTAGAVLIRALEPLSGLAVMQRRRPKARRVEDLASGPGKLALAMGVTRKLNGADLVKGPLTVRELRDEEAFETAVGPRIGITHCADWPLRFSVAGSGFVSR